MREEEDEDGDNDNKDNTKTRGKDDVRGKEEGVKDEKEEEEDVKGREEGVKDEKEEEEDVKGKEEGVKDEKEEEEDVKDMKMDLRHEENVSSKEEDGKDEEKDGLEEEDEVGEATACKKRKLEDHVISFKTDVTRDEGGANDEEGDRSETRGFTGDSARNENKIRNDEGVIINNNNNNKVNNKNNNSKNKVSNNENNHDDKNNTKATVSEKAIDSSYDDDCDECHVRMREPTEEELFICLHALSYEVLLSHHMPLMMALFNKNK